MGLESVLRVDHPPLPASNTVPHWPPGFGNRITTVHSIMIHETSGVPAYSGIDTFMGRYQCTVIPDRGIGPQYFVETNGTAYTIIGNQDFAGDPRQTWHGGWPDLHIDMNPISLGIENADIGDSGNTPGNGTGPHWWQLSTQAEDLSGMKLYLALFPGNDPDAVLIWFARFPQKWITVAVPAGQDPWRLQATGVNTGFQGAGEITDGANPATDRHITRPRAWRLMLFTERNFRSLVLLVRLLAEQNGLPRNFPLLPYASADGERTNPDVFRKLILAEQRRDEIAVQLGTTTAAIQANDAAWRQFYGQHPTTTWSRLFGVQPGQGASAAHPHGVLSSVVTPCFRGIIAHSINGGHPCPGPLFDWHRFAREIWDWWWYPFDHDAVGAVTTMRPYFQARHSTPLLEYYWDEVGTANDYNGMRQLLSTEEAFLLPGAVPVYAMANGVVVAARMADVMSPNRSFVLVRHEVFYRTGANNRINYDREPTYVWTLTTCLNNTQVSIPAAPPAAPGATPADNPTWLNRFIMRLRECELAVQFHNAHAGDATLRTAWGHNPSGAGPRAAVGVEIEHDADAYRLIATALIAGNAALFPLESSTNTTAVRMCLGDFLGYPGTIAGGQGVQTAIFSKEELPVPNRAQRAVSGSAEDWWTKATEAVRHDGAVEKDLPANGMAWHYPMTDFLTWINNITWASEWPKYGAAGAQPLRPQTRIVT
jgi:hypothetical protein